MCSLRTFLKSSRFDCFLLENYGCRNNALHTCCTSVCQNTLFITTGAQTQYVLQRLACLGEGWAYLNSELPESNWLPHLHCHLRHTEIIETSAQYSQCLLNPVYLLGLCYPLPFVSFLRVCFISHFQFQSIHMTKTTLYVLLFPDSYSFINYFYSGFEIEKSFIYIII